MFLLYLDFPEKATVCSGVAGRSIWNAEVEQGIGVTVCHNALHMEKVAGSAPLVPELLPASAPEPSRPRFQCQLHRFSIRETQHQDILGVHMLNNHRNQL